MLITNHKAAVAPQIKQPTAKTDSQITSGKDSFQKTVTGAAYAAGGALGGMALGAVSGEVLSRVTQNELFSSLGGGLGAVGGAATSLALSLSDEPVSVARTFGAWAGSTAGATGGIYLLGGAGRLLTSGGASALFATHGALIGALGAGMAGAGVAFAGDEGKVATVVRSAAKASAGVLGGLAAGGLAQTFTSSFPHLAPLAATAPIVGAAVLGLVGLQSEINKGWTSHQDEYEPRSKALDTVTNAALGAGAGYSLGFVAGAVGHNLVGAAGYSAVLPVLSAGLGATAILGLQKKSETLTGLTMVGSAVGAGGIAGDLVGRGLTLLTGQPAFTYLGAAAGAATGAAYGLEAEGFVKNRYLAPTVGGTVGATVGGTLLGSALSALTGQSGYQLAGTAIGATAGLLLGVAAGAGRSQSPATLAS